MTADAELASRLAGRAVAIVGAFRFRETLASAGRVYFPAQYAQVLARHVPVLWLNPPQRRVRPPHDVEGVLVADLWGRQPDVGFFGRFDGLQARAALRAFRSRHRARELLLFHFSTIFSRPQHLDPVRRVAFVGDSFFPIEHPYLRVCHLVVCSSQLHADAVEQRPELPPALQLSMGVTDEFLAQAERARAEPPPGTLRRLFAQPERPLAAYFGSLERADVSLLEGLARARPALNLLCAGTAAGARDTRRRALLALPNVRELAEYRHADMTALLRDVDVGLIAYRRDPFNLGSSPTKLFEYFALDLPVVSTDLAYPPQERALVRIAGDGPAAALAVDEALAETSSDSRRRALAERSTPAHRLNAILRALDGR